MSCSDKKLALSAWGSVQPELIPPYFTENMKKAGRACQTRWKINLYRILSSMGELDLLLPPPRLDLIQRIDVCLGSSNNDIRISAMASYHSIVLLE